MRIHFGKKEYQVLLSRWRQKQWEKMELQEDGRFQAGDMIGKLNLQTGEEFVHYQLCVDSEDETVISMELTDTEAVRGNGTFHIIPCCIYGDNNCKVGRPGEFPMLTYEHPEKEYCSPYWFFRADRAATPIAFMSGKEGSLGVTVNPYSEENGNYIHNGLSVSLPGSVGITLGSVNLPVTAVTKRNPKPSVEEGIRHASCEGRIYYNPKGEHSDIYAMIEREYVSLAERPTYKKSFEEAARALFRYTQQISWKEELGEYTNLHCKLPQDPVMRVRRTVTEIGWTGGAVLAYPLVLARHMLKEPFTGRSGEAMIDSFVARYNEKSGLIYEQTKPVDGKDFLKVWVGTEQSWECHCAYTNGSCIYGILKTIDYLKSIGEEYPEKWLETCKKVIGTVISLQREDGAFGYAFSGKEKKVLDFDSFGGAWFIPSCALLYKFEKNEMYLESAKAALRYYAGFVKAVNCYGTPLDTLKAVDQEGNLGYLKGARLVYELTGEKEFLTYLEWSAHYEYTWRYAFKARPICPPLSNSDWNSCGGSVTSVSNMHIHPMGVLVDPDLIYLSKVTGNPYHYERAMDSIHWLMQSLELYPDTMGFDTYGGLTERFCPSDATLVEFYGDGTPASVWFSYNLWAAANALEAILEYMRRA